MPKGLGSITGHGCFGRFLCRIVRQNTPGCFHCGSDYRGIIEDTVLHTLLECPDCEMPRRGIVTAVRAVSPLPATVSTVLPTVRR